MKNFSTFIQHYASQGKTGLVALVVIALTTFAAIAGYWITPDSTSNANTMCLAVALKKPGFSATFLKVKLNTPAEKNSLFSRMLWGNDPQYKWIPINNYRYTDKGIFINEYTGDADTSAQFNQLYSYSAIATGKEKSTDNAETLAAIAKTQIVKKTFWLGTDNYGRDLLSRLLIGSRITLSVGFISVFIAVVIGITIGALAGYYRGRLDDALMWFMNVVWSVPTMLLVIAITLAIGKGFWQVFIAVGLTMWVDVARLVRGRFFSLREQEFVQAAKVLGYSGRRIIFRHILPNVSGPVIVMSCANFASAILLESGLSFLGVGVQPPVPSWGHMLKESYGYITMDAAYLALLPGICIMLLVMSFGLVGVSLEKMTGLRK